MHELYSFFRGGEGVAAVDSCQGGVIRGLDAEFDDNRTNRADRIYRIGGISGIGEGLQHCEDFLIEAVGACADDEAYDAGDGEGFAVESFKFIDWFVGVGEGLEISKI